jgi:prolyl oligopeptidase
VLIADDDRLGALVSNLDGHHTVLDLYVGNQGSLPEWKAIFRNMRSRAWPFLCGNRVFLYTRENAENGMIVELTGDGEQFRVIVPESSYPVQQHTALRDSLLVSHLLNGHMKIDQWSLTGSFLRTLDLPTRGSIQILPTYSSNASSAFALLESYTEAPRLVECGRPDLGSSITTRPASSSHRNYQNVKECSYTSRDGTTIPMVLLEPLYHHTAGVRPVILTGYGGFGVPELPRFSHLSNLMVELGAIVARPRIRGGSDFGEQWHTAATKRNRQTAIDDFIAAAEWLCLQGITDAQHLAIIGGSNAGLLVSAAMTQRPELFRAIICIGPLLDMIRYERFDQAARWRREYGTVEDADDFRALLSYSPYHNVKHTVDYPEVLFVTGDSDDRCNPAHVRKMAALLQGRLSQRKPVLVDHSPQWGHIPTLTLDERVTALARKAAFLCQTLGLSIPGDTDHGF